jgi:hypothetical protein
MRTILVLAFSIALTASAAVAGGDSTCPGEVNGDGIVDVQDLLQVIGEWGCAGCPSDVNGDGVTDINDLLIVLGDWGCETVTGPQTTLSGVVTNLWTGDPIEGASVTVGLEELTTNQDGEYSGVFPIGQYTVVFEADNYIEYEEDIILFPDVPAFLDVALEPVAPVIVTIDVTGAAEPGGSVSATAVVEIFDGSTLSGYSWMQTSGTPAVINGVNMETATLDLGTSAEYKEELFDILADPPVGPDQLPPNVPVPPGPFPGGIQDRFEVVGANPFALERAGLVGLGVEVTTSSGVYDGETEVHTHIPWKPAAGIRTVAIGLPVLVNGKEQASYDWALSVPMNSAAVLLDGTTQHPEFTPDIAGVYELTVTDLNAAELLTIQVFAGHWRGIIVGQDANGRPVSDPSCVGCHSVLGADKFTPWAQTGHAEVFTNNLNNSTHYGTYCFPCHTVGYDPDVLNNGIDDAPDFQDFIDAGLINNPGDNWTTMLAQFPASAQLANVQCENCHGPQWELPGVNTPAHGPVQPEGEPRISISSDVCAPCHGEPLRHARFQQWQFSGHANYDLAIEESQSGNCSRCHTGNGFLTWLPVLLGQVPGDPTGSIQVTWTEDEAHPQTCVTCHDPHSIGTTSGGNTNATVRISGNTPQLIAGFTAYGVGRGAICMTCHNSRRGLRNDSTWPQYVGTSESVRAAHGSAQTDVLMGENAYLVMTGFRGNHSFLEDSCVKCHMEETPPPDILAYNQGGTNHTFYAALDICENCHGPGFEASAIQDGIEDTLHLLQAELEAGWNAVIDEQLGLGNTIDFNGDLQVADPSEILGLEFTEYHGRQALAVTTANGPFGPYRLSDIDVVDPGMVVLGALYAFASDELPQAGWNWTLVHNDSSLGIHNPTYAYQVLGAGLNALGGGDTVFEMPAWLEDWKIKE